MSLSSIKLSNIVFYLPFCHPLAWYIGLSVMCCFLLTSNALWPQYYLWRISRLFFPLSGNSFPNIFAWGKYYTSFKVQVKSLILLITPLWSLGFVLWTPEAPHYCPSVMFFVNYAVLSGFSSFILLTCHLKLVFGTHLVTTKQVFGAQDQDWVSGIPV